MKTYKSLSSSELCIYLIIKGRLRQVKFRLGKYSSTSEAEQQALESHHSYGRSFTLVKESKVAVAEEQTQTLPPVVYENVKRVNEAVSILEEKHGVKGIRGKSDVLLYASKLNVSFPNLK